MLSALNADYTLAQILETKSGPASIIDVKCTILSTNSKMLSFLNLPRDQVVHNKCCRLLHGSETPLQGCPLLTMINLKKQIDVHMQIKNNPFLITLAPIMNTSWQLLGGLHIMTDTADQEPESHELSRIVSQAREMLEPG